MKLSATNDEEKEVGQMKKKIGIIALSVLMVFALVPVDIAKAVDFALTVSIEAASELVVTADKRNGQTEAIIEADVDALDFDPMELNSQTGVFESAVFYTVDAKSSGDGAGDPQVTVNYIEGNIPQGQTDGLGHKATAAFTKVTFPNNIETITDLNAQGPKKLLKDVNNQLVTDTELEGGFLRVFVGVFLGDDQNLINAGGSPFTAADQIGTYTGTLQVTGSVI